MAGYIWGTSTEKGRRHKDRHSWCVIWHRQIQKGNDEHWVMLFKRHWTIWQDNSALILHLKFKLWLKCSSPLSLHLLFCTSSCYSVVLPLINSDTFKLLSAEPWKEHTNYSVWLGKKKKKKKKTHQHYKLTQTMDNTHRPIKQSESRENLPASQEKGLCFERHI